MKELTQEVFKDKPKEVTWAGVDYDGNLNFGIPHSPRYPWAAERWRGFDKIGNTIEKTDFKRGSSIRRI